VTASVGVGSVRRAVPGEDIAAQADTVAANPVGTANTPATARASAIPCPQNEHEPPSARTNRRCRCTMPAPASHIPDAADPTKKRKYWRESTV
jgi:hypothetical protein